MLYFVATVYHDKIDKDMFGTVFYKPYTRMKYFFIYIEKNVACTTNV